MRPGPYGRRIAVAWILLAVVVAGCYGDIPAPPLPTEDRVPTIVGQIEGWADPNVSYRLDTGDVVQVHGPTPAKNLNGGVWLADFDHPAGLLLAGEDALGPFYAATGFDEGDGCFVIQGDGYIDPDRVHFSSGLVLPLTPDTVVHRDRTQFGETWLFAFDRVCLDRQGRVTSIRQLQLGA